jgi:hypothetical protein
LHRCIAESSSDQSLRIYAGQGSKISTSSFQPTEDSAGEPKEFTAGRKKKKTRTEDSVYGVHRYLILGSIANETLSIRKCHIARSGSVSLVVSDDLHAIMLPHSDAAIRGSKIDAYCRSFTFTSHCKIEYTTTNAAKLDSIASLSPALKPQSQIRATLEDKSEGKKKKTAAQSAGENKWSARGKTTIMATTTSALLCNDCEAAVTVY